MVICPVAIAVGCRKCPIFKVCPVKSVIGDYKPPEASPGKSSDSKPRAKSSPAKARAAKSRARRK